MAGKPKHFILLISNQDFPSKFILQEKYHVKTTTSADTKRLASCRMNAVSILARMLSYKVRERDGEKMPVILLNPRAAPSQPL